MKKNKENKKNKKNIYGIVIVGVGGTGSFVACDLAHYLTAASPSIKRSVSVVLADGDLVENKNRSRQMYFPEDVGRNKADCLAQSINDAYELEFLSSGSYINTVEDVEKLVGATESQLNSRMGNYDCDVVPVILSCVDNIPARKILETYFKSQESCIYIDSGNGFSNGQCIFAVKDEGVVVSPARDFYGFQFEEEVSTQKSREESSCEELNNVAPQHFVTNRWAANTIISAIFQLLEGQGVVRGFTSYDAFKGTSTHMIPEAFGFEMKEIETEAAAEDEMMG